MHSKYFVMCEFNEAGNANIHWKSTFFLTTLTSCNLNILTIINSVWVGRNMSFKIAVFPFY